MAFDISKLVQVSTDPLILVYTTTDPLSTVTGDLYFASPAGTQFGALTDAVILIQSPYFDVSVPVPPVALTFVRSSGGAVTFTTKPTNRPVLYANQGTKTSGTFTLNRTNGSEQYYVNGGAHTLAPQSAEGTITTIITNNASAGAITTSGYTRVVGSLTTTNAHKFLTRSTRTPAETLLEIVAYQ
jgi:hypothetical protein